MQTARAFVSPPRAREAGVVQLRVAFQAAPACRTHPAGTPDKPPAAAETMDTATLPSAGRTTAYVAATAASAYRAGAEAIEAPAPPPRESVQQTALSIQAGATPGPWPRPTPPGTSPHPAARRYPQTAARIRRRPIASPHPLRPPPECAPPPPWPREYGSGYRTGSARTPANRPVHPATAQSQWCGRRGPLPSQLPGRSGTAKDCPPPPDRDRAPSPASSSPPALACRAVPSPALQCPGRTPADAPARRPSRTASFPARRALAPRAPGHE